MRRATREWYTNHVASARAGELPVWRAGNTLRMYRTPRRLFFTVVECYLSIIRIRWR